jgi:hypothetical protein
VPCTATTKEPALGAFRWPFTPTGLDGRLSPAASGFVQQTLEIKFSLFRPILIEKAEVKAGLSDFVHAKQGELPWESCYRD